ncbi:hypothetical protein [Phormidium sp. CCY1219]|uniref:hypothetical protein n=1 Tax=Phormidium sp. CCY1219 TaxID=2886104 RepID=UPI002D1EE47B|nr:hypothetical protein [Phormidium sp. CCY1219]MEB3828836.1 hypothetical protein [Phormidium sp. CCY1219]
MRNPYNQFLMFENLWHSSRTYIYQRWMDTEFVWRLWIRTTRLWGGIAPAPFPYQRYFRIVRLLAELLPLGVKWR